MSTTRLGTLCQDILKKFNNNHFFESLNTLPKCDSVSKEFNTNCGSLAANKHPLVLIESQTTLFQIRNLLESLAQAETPVTEEALQPIQELLFKRFKRVNNPDCDSYFYGANIPFKANDVCIALAKEIAPYYPGQHWIQCLIPNCEVENLSAKEDFNFGDYQCEEISEDDNDEPIFKLNERIIPRPTHLTAYSAGKLYDALYTSIFDIPRLIKRLYHYMPQNTWQLYLNCLYDSDLLGFAVGKAADCEVIKTNYSPENFYKLITKSTVAYIRYQNKLFYANKVIGGTTELPLNQDMINKFDEYYKPVLDKPKLLSTKQIREMDHILGEEIAESIEKTEIDMQFKRVEAILLDPTEKSEILWALYDALFEEFQKPKPLNENEETSISYKKDDDSWNRAILYVLTYFYRYIRSMLPDYLDIGRQTVTYYLPNTGLFKSTSKKTKEKEAQAFLEFLESNEPLATVEKWLQARYRDLHYSLSPSVVSGLINTFKKTNGRLDDIYAMIKKQAQPLKQEQTLGWFSFKRA